MKIEKLFLALCAKNLVVDLICPEGHFQINGDRRVQGMFERIFHSGSHPTRRRIKKSEAQEALDRAIEFRLWTSSTRFQVVSEDELESRLAPFPVR